MKRVFLFAAAVITIATAACVQFQAPLPGNDAFPNLPPIVAWRLASGSTTFDEILAVNPDGSNLTTVAKLPTDKVKRQASVSWLQDHRSFVIWRVQSSNSVNGIVSLFNGTQERRCLGRRFVGEPVIFESQPMLSETNNIVYTTPLLADLQGYGRLNLQTCRYEITRTYIPQGDFYATTYCIPKKWWGFEDLYAGSIIYDQSITAMAHLSITAALSWSPDCSKLVGAKSNGWYLFETGKWDSPVQILSKDLSAHFLLMRDSANVVISRPSWSPDQRYFVYSTHLIRGGVDDLYGRATSYIVDTTSGTEQVLLDDAAYPDWRK